MYNSYADTLESYIIDDIAEEGIGSIAAGIGIFIAGITLIGKISDAKQRKRLKALAKANAGKPSDYGNSIYSILRKYSKDITGVLEPKKSNEYLKLVNEKLAVAKEMDHIRQDFSKMDPYDEKMIPKYKQILSRISGLQSKVDLINKKLNDESMNNLSSSVVKLESTKLKKLHDISWETAQILWNGGHDGYSLIMTEDFYFSDKGSVYDYTFSEPKECHDKFDALVSSIIGEDGDPDDVVMDYIRKCKFALDPNSKLK